MNVDHIIELVKQIGGKRASQFAVFAFLGATLGAAGSYHSLRKDIEISGAKLELVRAEYERQISSLDKARAAEAVPRGDLHSCEQLRKEVSTRLEECQQALVSSQAEASRASKLLEKQASAIKDTPAAARAREASCEADLARRSWSLTPQSESNACQDALLHKARSAHPGLMSVSADVDGKHCSCSLVLPSDQRR